MTRSLCALVLLFAALPALRAGERLVIVPSKDPQPALILPSDWLAQHRPLKQDVLGFGSPVLPAILAGAALSIGLVLLGLLFARRASARFAAGATACLLGGFILINSSCSSNNNRDNLYSYHERGVNPPTLREDGTLQGEVLLEEGFSGDALRLAIDPDAFKGLGKSQAKP